MADAVGYRLTPLRGWHNAQQPHMTWRLQHLCLILALASVGTGAERREKVAHGVSRGIAAGNRTSPGGASENKSHSVSCLRGLRVRLIVSPLPGLVAFRNAVPRLTPWATIYRRYAACTTRATVA